MKVAVSVEGASLEAPVAKSFGRCPYFLIIDSETMKFEAVQNPGASMSGGAGPAAARVINERDSKILLTGMVGPNALSVLANYGIEAVTGTSGSAEKAVKNYLHSRKIEN